MKNIKYTLISCLAVLFVVLGCEEEDAVFGDVIAPSNLVVTADVVGQDASNPNGDGSGVVTLSASADNAISYKFIYNGTESSAPSGTVDALFTNLGVNTYVVNVIAYGTGGVSTTTSITVDVLATYTPPQELVDKLIGDGTKVWRLKSETPGHFGLGPVGGGVVSEWYGAGPQEKVGVGMYDDRFIFGNDGTFTHITNINNEDASGTIFGRGGLVSEIGQGGTPNGDDVENVPYNDYTESFVIIAPGGVETINLGGLGFISYYTGSHSYEIFDRSVPNEIILKTTDANNDFDWWFILTSEDESSGGEFNSVFNDLVWSDEFDVDGAPDAANWTYDLGAGGWGNQESQTYTDNAENVIIEDGFLKITAKANGNSYTSARIKSEGLYDFTYGRAEIRAKLPSSVGTWPAIWMLGSDYQTNTWPACGEIDIMEQKGQDKNTVLSTVHHPAVSPGAGDSASTQLTTSTTEFHLYSVEWTAQSITFLVDNEVFHTIENSANLPFHSDFFFILNVAMGGTLGGTIDPNFTEDSMEVDYVRVYQ
ncbi:glycoside hydrolase family 16 protein [Winogradskyella sp. F6397]|uniref:Glycoside hydrolase family 16 protein n=1 Tax=Winogradskyella marina TaxID=2785530 RepID=A0ABS0EIF7_9FLAO|nr:glycoside hydrolase family 16 protein [Winogradskyella marina]MBF8150244.1 glycoside hydrolase family 16 protein [Winogradskyella marina]